MAVKKAKETPSDQNAESTMGGYQKRKGGVGGSHQVHPPEPREKGTPLVEVSVDRWKGKSYQNARQKRHSSPECLPWGRVNCGGETPSKESHQDQKRNRGHEPLNGKQTNRE